ncbi:MAG TPA: aminotransferase class V-fold PLP-dependent enzyme [Acidisarcina sp.]|nr:aminotransferase class V-fold PLP-dependent enzyme [Acidisarcina sp.]
MTTLTETRTDQLTLDPENWAELRALGHRMLDDIFQHLETLRKQPAWQPMPAAVTQELNRSLPLQGQGAEEVYEEFLSNVLPYTSGNRHPRAWGWVRGNGTPLAMLADMLASGINAHLGGGQQAPILVEKQVIAWMAEVMGMPASSSGILTSGGTMANLIGLAVARHAKAGFDVRQEGLQGDHPQLLVYGSAETHMWARKSMELLGLGRRSLRRIAVDADHRIVVAELEKQIAADRDAGHQPIAVIANAGTVNTGAIDDIEALLKVCRREDLWLHVDGAFGALLKLSPRYSSLVRGIEKADSLAFDMHKWMYLPFGIGCVLFRDAAEHSGTFATPANYLESAERGLLAGGMGFSDLGIELTRSFNALKLWMSLKAHGLETYSALIEQNVEQVKHLASLIDQHVDLQRMAPQVMNVLCFRYAPPSYANDTEKLNALNREIVMRMQESGQFIVSGTVLNGEYAMRVANTNHRSRMEDFDALVAEVLLVGEELAFSEAEDA